MLPLYPKNREIEAYLEIIRTNRISSGAVKEMERQIKDSQGTIGNFVDWKYPDKWIDERLTGVGKETANLFWENSEKVINPRYTKPIRWVIEKKGLVNISNEGYYELSVRGRSFIKGGEVLRYVDYEEGLAYILFILSNKPGLKRRGLIPIWKRYVKKIAPEWDKPSSIADLLSRRLSNLRDRGLLKREGFNWFITEEGDSYIKSLDVSKFGRITYDTPIEGGKISKGREASDHDLTQLRLVELGYLMGFAVYVARSDKSKGVRGVKLADYEIGELPAKGLSRELKDAMANIDIIWFEPEVYTPVAFIEIETTTGFVKNLQKINDLLSEMPPGYARSAGVYIVGYDKDRGEAEKIMWGDAFRRLDGRCREYKFVNVEEVATVYKNLKSRLDLQFQKIKEAEEEIEKRKKNIEKIKDGKFSLFALS